MQFAIDLYFGIIDFSIRSYYWSIFAFWWTVDFTYKTSLALYAIWMQFADEMYLRYIDFYQYMDRFNYDITYLVLPWYLLYPTLFSMDFLQVSYLIFFMGSSISTLTLVFAPFYLDAVWTLILSPVVIFSIPMIMEQLY